MEETAAAKVTHLCVFLAVVGAILIVGWDAPLRYCFMSRQEIDAIERPAPPPPAPGTPEWLLDRAKKNPLSRPPYR